MNFSRVKISTTVPTTHAEKVRQAIGQAGAGEPGKLETVKEEYIMVECPCATAKRVVHALKKAHPYEEVIIDIVPLLETSDI